MPVGAADEGPSGRGPDQRRIRRSQVWGSARQTSSQSSSITVMQARRQATAGRENAAGVEDLSLDNQAVMCGRGGGRRAGRPAGGHGTRRGQRLRLKDTSAEAPPVICAARVSLPPVTRPQLLPAVSRGPTSGRAERRTCITRIGSLAPFKGAAVARAPPDPSGHPFFRIHRSLENGSLRLNDH